MNTQKQGRSKLIKEAVAFFYANAGYSYNPKTETQEQGKLRCAKSLAKAERNAASAGITFEWEFDQEGCSGCDCKSDECKCSTGEEHETLCCSARDSEGKVCASLCGICEPSREYRRVVQAELASEALS